MTKQKKTTRRPALNHRFVGLREAILAGGAGPAPSSNSLAINTNSGGATSGSFALSPIGLTSATTGATNTGTYSNGTAGNVCGPLLRGLYNRALDFQWYRVTRARLIFVGTQGSSTTGIITLVGYTSPLDVAIGTGIPQLSSSSTKTFDLSNASTKELSVPIPVDSSWKRVTSLLTVSGASVPFFGGSTSIVPVSTVDDICFGAVSYSVGSGPVGTGTGTYIGTLFLDYDVEFKGVIDASVNQ